MSVVWHRVICPVTFQPVYALIAGGRRITQVTTEHIREKLVSETDLMLHLLDKEFKLSDGEIAEAFCQLKKILDEHVTKL